MVDLDAGQIRILAHPLRARLLLALRLDGPATATMLARQLNTNTGATSYHLRQLADAGLVVEEGDRATGRERWWRSAHDMSNWHPHAFGDDPDASAAAEWMQRHLLRTMSEETERWFTEWREYPPEWQEVADFSDYILELSPDRLRVLNEELAEVVERHRRAAARTAAGADVDGTEQVRLFLGAFPRRRTAR